jgi:hypothetical protein
MSAKKYRDAELILKLYELRREETMRKARAWMARDFFPESPEEFLALASGEHSGYFRMVLTYWDMACSFVNHGAIDEEMFNDANSEHLFYFAKLQPYLEVLRTTLGNPKYLKNLEKVALRTPNIEERLEGIRRIQRSIAAQQAKAAEQPVEV